MGKYCHLQARKILKYLGISLFFLISFIPLFLKPIYSATNDTINLEGKIVRNDTGYEGLNVTTGSPACVLSGNNNDTCDFQVKYYSANVAGTVFLTETFENVEIGQYNGAFNLSLGTGIILPGSYASLNAMIQKEDNIFIEILFSPSGDGVYTETFSRMPLQSSAYSIRSKYSSGASGAFQFNTSSDASGYTTPSAGMVYFDTSSNTLKIYNGTSWENIASGSSGSNLWTDAGGYTYLTDVTDSFSLGSTSYTAIGSKTYSDYLLGLSSNSPFSFDMGGERMSISGDQSQSGLTVLSNYSGSNPWPLVTFKSNSVNFDSTVLNVVQGGTGKLASFSKADTEIFSFENDQTFYISKRNDAPVNAVDRLYNVNGSLFWNGSSVCTLATGCGSSSLWTDGGTYTYLTSTTDSVGIGGATPETSKFFFDVSNGRLGIGTSTPNSKFDIVGDGSAINLQEWRNSLGNVLSLINQYGHATFGRATGGNAILSLGSNSATLPQMNFATSNGIDITNPNDGDLWWNGTNLYFFDGKEKIDLLGKKDRFVVYGLTPHNGFLNLEHNQNTYSMISDGFVCVGGSHDQNCTGGEWKSIDEFKTGVTHTNNSDWSGGVLSNVTVNTGDIELTSGNSGIYTSAPISTANAKSYGNISWNEELGGTGKIAVQTRSGDYEQKAFEVTTDGTVSTQQVSPDGKTLYIGGSFENVYEKYYGSGVMINKDTGAVIGENCAKVNGVVRVSLPDGNGGFYIGGGFTKVGGVERNRIAHINSDCSLDMNFNPNANGEVVAMVLHGTTLYVGGWFTSIGGQSRNYIASIDVNSGGVTSFNPNADDYVTTMLLNGTTLYVGGDFTNIGGQGRNKIAGIDINNGLATSFNPNANGTVSTILLNGSILYVGGWFTSIGGQSRNYIAGIDVNTGLVTSFNLNPDSVVGTMLLNGMTLYIAGGFTMIDGETRNYIAEIDATSGLLASFDPNLTGPVSTMVLNGATLYVGGDFTSIGGQSRNRIAGIDINTGLATNFDLNVNGSVSTVSLSDNILYVGGDFSSIGGQSRNNIAGIDISNGSVTSFNPNANSCVSAISLSDTTLYVGGNFTNIGGQSRNNIAGIDISTGQVTDFNPDASSNVYTMLLSGTTLYVGGQFTSIGGQSRSRIAGIDISNGSVTSFNPNANGTVSTMLLSGNILYVGGYFSSIGGQSRNSIAGIDISNGSVTSFNPNANGTVSTMLLNGTTLYVGGQFTNIGGQSRSRIAGIDISTGLATDFNPNANSNVSTMLLSGTTLYVGGQFTSIGGESRNSIAGIDISNGSVTSFNPNVVGIVSTMLLNDSILYVGGGITHIGGQLRSNLGAIDINTSQIATKDISNWSNWGNVIKRKLNNSDIHTTWESDSQVFEGDIVRQVVGFEDENELDVTKITKVVANSGGYIETNITENLSTYDYVTLWIQSNTSGQSLTLTAGTLSKVIDIQKANQWQKVYIDISNLSQTEKENIRKIRIANTSSSTSTFYVDNLDAEQILSNSTGTKIFSSPKKHIQYRVIFTNTDGISKPKLNDITLEYNSQYEIVYQDMNNIRLYNYSGQNQYLKLEAKKDETNFLSSVRDINGAVAFQFDTINPLLNPGAKLLSIKNGGNEKMYLDANGNLYISGDILNSTGDSRYISLAPTLPQIDLASNSNSIWINKTGIGGDLIKLQTDGSDVFVVNRVGDLTMSGNASVDGGTLTLGNKGNIRFNNGTNQIEFSKDGGLTWIKVGDAISKIVLSAEYAGAVLTADGSNNIGSMTSDNTGTTSNSMNYYDWNSGELTLNDYDIRVRITLPSNFDIWGSGGITIHYATESNNVANNKLDAYIFEQTQSLVDASSENNVSDSAGVWKTTTISGSDLDQCVGANKTCLLNLKVSSLGDNYVRVGDIVLEYSRTL